MFIEENIYKALPLTGVHVIPNDLHAGYQMKKLEKVIVKFKSCKQKKLIIHKLKNLGNTPQELTSLKFSRLFVSESMSNENQQLPYKC